MWNIWKEEVYKIATRKILWIGLFLLLAFVSLRLFTERNHYSATIDGQIYRGQKAIEKDQQLTAKYAGILTDEKVQNIYEDFGFSYYHTQADANSGNFCNEWITRHMTNYNQIADNHPIDTQILDDIQFLQGDAWETYAAPYLNETIWFDYTYGWNDLKETYSFMTIALFVLFMIGLSPIFSEEYMLKTADILLTTKRGKKSCIWIKMGASLSFITILYVVFSIYLWVIYRIVYGTQGLEASPAMIGLTPAAYMPADIHAFFYLSFGLGLAGLLLLTCISMAISSLCKNSFLTILLSLAAFFLPYVWLNVLSIMVAPFFSNALWKAITYLMISMPLCLPVNWGFTFSLEQIGMHIAIALAAGIACALAGYWKFRNYQG